MIVTPFGNGTTQPFYVKVGRKFFVRKLRLFGLRYSACHLFLFCSPHSSLGHFFVGRGSSLSLSRNFSFLAASLIQHFVGSR